MYIIQDYFTNEVYGYDETFQGAKAIADSFLGSQVVFEGEILYTNIELPF